ncbi:hypothetical protein [Lapillicoccus jejuensis]|uniref:Uncharacterized protein n=1 Tax=Lapillicoccus jejuensis TaxID=402171 RepID=A0A542E5D0_9MICO|nr:hypothetical protein [Lapillicoccus jejuensis]TQJ10543.1 hypothetical protein FB458_3672 [Lapillicoccus jejuensis]
MVPEVAEQGGTRSTSALGRAVVADALRPVDPVGAAAAQRDTSWRQGYLTHFRRLVEVGLADEAAALGVARAGLASVHERMRVRVDDGEDDRPLAEAFTARPGGARPLRTEVVTGTGRPRATLSLPLRGGRLEGDALLRQLDDWLARGILEPAAAQAVRTVAAEPERLRLEGRRVVVLGAGAEMGPLRALLGWGADVVGVDLPRPEIWRRLRPLAQESGGRLTLPVSDPGGGGGASGDGGGVEGADLLHDLAAVADWLTDLDGPLVLGNYVYADGATNLRVSTAVDALSAELLGRRDDLALAFLATPTDVFAVPGEAVVQSARGYDEPAAATRLLRPALRAVSGGRLLKRNYAPGSDPGLNDSVVPQQGPNYLLAKRIQRWRATAARRDGVDVSLKVAPPTRTRSVLRNRALAAAYAGAHRFGIEVFEPATSNTLMAALLVHDLTSPRPPLRPPWEEEADGAVHGGLWRAPYDPRSALGLAVVLGVGGARG